MNQLGNNEWKFIVFDNFSNGVTRRRRRIMGRKWRRWKVWTKTWIGSRILTPWIDAHYNPLLSFFLEREEFKFVLLSQKSQCHERNWNLSTQNWHYFKKKKKKKLKRKRSRKKQTRRGEFPPGNRGKLCVLYLSLFVFSVSQTLSLFLFRGKATELVNGDRGVSLFPKKLHS